MNNAVRALGVSVLTLTVGLGAAACSSSTPPPPAAATASAAVHTPAEVATALNGFFTTVDKETKAAVASPPSAVSQAASKSTAEEQQSAMMKKMYPESMKSFDEKAVGDAKEASLIAVVGMSSIGSALPVASETGIVMKDDTATVPSTSISVMVDGKATPGKDGSITMKYESGKWVITDYTGGSGSATPTDSPTVTVTGGATITTESGGATQVVTPTESATASK